jgi:glyoxylase-like metal-dependent hydrolase (beta-lactamase superfamily II)
MPQAVDSSSDGIVCIKVPVPYMGTVNTWLLLGEPLTLIDTGFRDHEALLALERGLGEAGVRFEDLELLLATHHHIDHSGLLSELQRRSGAEVAMLEGVAGRCADPSLDAEHLERFTEQLFAAYGVPDSSPREEFWDVMSTGTEPVLATRQLRDGETLVAGGRTLRAVQRPGHTSSDTLWYDEPAQIAFCGDHLLATVSSNTELAPVDGATLLVGERPTPLIDYIQSLRETKSMTVSRLYPGHGGVIDDHAALISRRLGFHRERCAKITAILGDGAATAVDVAGRLWPAKVVREQRTLTLWEVLGHLDLLIADGTAVEYDQDGGPRLFDLRA